MSDGLRLCAVSLEVVSLRCVHVQTSKPSSPFNREGTIKACDLNNIGRRYLVLCGGDEE